MPQSRAVMVARWDAFVPHEGFVEFLSLTFNNFDLLRKPSLKMNLAAFTSLLHDGIGGL